MMFERLVLPTKRPILLLSSYTDHCFSHISVQMTHVMFFGPVKDSSISFLFLEIVCISLQLHSYFLKTSLCSM